MTCKLNYSKECDCCHGCETTIEDDEPLMENCEICGERVESRTLNEVEGKKHCRLCLTCLLDRKWEDMDKEKLRSFFDLKKSESEDNSRRFSLYWWNNMLTSEQRIKIVEFCFKDRTEETIRTILEHEILLNVELAKYLYGIEM